MRTMGLFALAVAAPGLFAALPGDSKRGAELFSSEGCIACHAINGKGGKAAPDLGRRIGREFSPGILAGLMWNHAPRMWSSMESKGLSRPSLDEQKASDLFAYFFAAKFFERPGDAGRGRKVFVEKGCSGCHGLAGQAGSSGAPPVASWSSLTDPISLGQQMWAHAPRMLAAMQAKKMKWPSLSSQEMTDLMVYLQNLPGTKGQDTQFALTAATGGKELLETKGCVVCHTGDMALANQTGHRTLTDFAAAMWNHAPHMLQLPPPLSRQEMDAVLTYLWSVQFFDDKGNANRGRKVFAEKRCESCHTDGPGPKLGKRDAAMSNYGMIAILWKHGPTMLEEMKKKNIAWPRFRGIEMSDLVAYLNSLK